MNAASQSFGGSQEASTRTTCHKKNKLGQNFQIYETERKCGEGGGPRMQRPSRSAAVRKRQIGQYPEK